MPTSEVRSPGKNSKPKVSSLSSAYSLREVGDFDVEFTSEFGVLYRASFGDASGYFVRHPEFASLVQGFGFQIIGGASVQVPHDARVGVTVSLIVQNHFEQHPEAVLFFIHDSSDGKEHGRRKKFDTWYRKLSSGQLLKKDAEIPIGRFAILASILVRNDHPQLDQIVAGFDELVVEAGVKPE